jgi:predicted secreted protein
MSFVISPSISTRKKGGNTNYGRKVVLLWDGTRIPGVREKSLSLNGEPVNITSNENHGTQALLSEDQETSVTIELSGLTKSDVLRKAKAAGRSALTESVTITYDDGAIISGIFRLGGYSEGKPYNDAVTFKGTLKSTGPVTYISG